MAKHLCGVATDISLRSAATFSLPPDSSSSSSTSTSSLLPSAINSNCNIIKSNCRSGNGSSSSRHSNGKDNSNSNSVGKGDGEVLSSQLRGVAIATCCHHACTWRDYVGASFLNSLPSNFLPSNSQAVGESSEGDSVMPTVHTLGLTGAEFDVLKQWSG